MVPVDEANWSHSRPRRWSIETKMFEWRAPDDPLRDIALDHLTLARVALYRVLLEPAGTPSSALSMPDVGAALAGLRSASAAPAAPTTSPKPSSLQSSTSPTSTSTAPTSTAPASFATRPSLPRPACSSKKTATGGAEKNSKMRKPHRLTGRPYHGALLRAPAEP
ncbi:MAG: hypothetical protein ACI9QL_004898 [Candidatus Omnitrophota bacterium]|jgi:hypothetical protein